jgi:hypothetical protein
VSRPVVAIILHADPGMGAGPLARAVADARATLAGRHRIAFLAAGATDARIIVGEPDGEPFGRRLRTLLARLGDGRLDRGLVLLGSGAVPLATMADRREFVATAAGETPVALANNRYSADIVALARARASLVALPDDLATDNALPRWLTNAAGVTVRDLRHRWRLAVDIDGPLDLVLLGSRTAVALEADDRERVESRLAAIRARARDSRAELVVSGRTSAASLAWLERATASRTRAIVEERGMRTAASGQRPARSVLGALLERDGPASLGDHLARLGDAALVDTRVLLAHRHGTDERSWPDAEDRFASDLLLHERVRSPWLRALTESAAEAAIPVVLGGHTLVGPGLRLALRAPRASRP